MFHQLILIDVSSIDTISSKNSFLFIVFE
jgi:hypothetical protein